MSDQVRILAGDDGSRCRLPVPVILAALPALIVGLLIGRATAPDSHGTQRPVA